MQRDASAMPKTRNIGSGRSPATASPTQPTSLQRERGKGTPKTRHFERGSVTRNRASRTAHRDEINARKRHRLRTDTAYREKLYTARYGLSPEEYHEMLRQQGGVCAICRKPGRALVMDHCHATNVVRRPLCRKCNSGLGQFDDDPDALRAAAAYVEAFRAQGRKKKTTTPSVTPCGGPTSRRRRWRSR